MEGEKITPRECLVTGATGVLGVPLVSELVAQGGSVRVLIRDSSQGAAFPESVLPVIGDLSSDKAIEKAVAGVNWVFHLAAKLHVNDPKKDGFREYREVNVDGTEKLLRATAKSAVEKFIFFSTINVYGPSENGQIFDEASKLNPIGIYAETKAEAEKLVSAQRNDNGEKFGVVLRLAAVYGSRMKGNYLRLLKALKSGRFFYIGDAANRRTLIHQTDAAKAAILAAERAAGGTVYNVTDGEIHTLKEIVEAMCSALKISPPRIRLPLGPVTLAIGAVDDLGKLLGVKTPVNRQLLEKYLEDVAVSGEKIQKELAFSPTFDLVSGWGETVANMPRLEEINPSKSTQSSAATNRR